MPSDDKEVLGIVKSSHDPEGCLGNASVTITSTVGSVTSTEVINAAAANDLSIDSLSFEGQAIRGMVANGGTDSYGRTYNISGNDLTITGATPSDQITITNFQQGDFGVDVANDNSPMFFRLCA